MSRLLGLSVCVGVVWCIVLERWSHRAGVGRRWNVRRGQPAHSVHGLSSLSDRASAAGPHAPPACTVRRPLPRHHRFLSPAHLGPTCTHLSPDQTPIHTKTRGRGRGTHRHFPASKAGFKLAWSWNPSFQDWYKEEQHVKQRELCLLH